MTALAGGAYVLGIPPFTKVGTIEESSVCASLGPSAHAVEALRSILPEQGSYRFDDETIPRRSKQDDAFAAYCFVDGDESQLLSVRALFQPDAPPDMWEEDVALGDPSHSLTRFDAGIRAVASHSMAAIFVPCEPRGVLPGGQHNLSVLVHLKQTGETSTGQRRAGLITLARSAAASAHERADCTMPFDVGGQK
ncbi:hypothetical protein [Streptomyces sp. NPDC047130]|uniref:hypothetical protein n=1 Tax=Streptomyces sp. NPDC047130 TaxID=3155261 RepID=UPI0033D8B3D9